MPNVKTRYYARKAAQATRRSLLMYTCVQCGEPFVVHKGCMVSDGKCASCAARYCMYCMQPGLHAPGCPAGSLR